MPGLPLTLRRLSSRASAKESHTARKLDLLAAAVIGIALLTAAGALPSVGLFDSKRTGDAELYRAYGENIRAGEIPYRDFYFEYPPGALPMIAIPALGSKQGYIRRSKALQWALGAVTIALVALTLYLVRRRRSVLYVSTALLGLAPAAFGYVTFTRFDFWPVALTAGALAALTGGWGLVAAALLGVGTTAKIYPAVLLPLMLLYTLYRRGARRAVTALAVYLGVIAAIVLPFAALAPGGVGFSLYTQFTRPLQIESLGASVLLVAHQLGAYHHAVVAGSGSQNFEGAPADLLAALTSLVEVAALLAVWLMFARSQRTASQLLTAAACAVTAFVIFGKVFSPQYLLWLLPLVVVVGGRARRPAIVLLTTALLLTQLFFDGRYHQVINLERITWLVVARDVAVLGLFLVLWRDVRSARSREPAPLRETLFGVGPTGGR